MNAELYDLLLQQALAITVALLAVLALRLPVRRVFGARIAYLAWSLVPLCMAAGLVPAPAQRLVLVADSASYSLPALLAATSAPAADGFEPRLLLLLLWGVGVAVASLLFAERQRRFDRLIARRPGQPFDEVSGHGPAVAGLLRPRIVLPGDFGQRYSPEEQALVLAHERLHLQRGDVAAQALATGLRCLFWFHPLVHFGAGRFRFDQELACDADVLARHPDSRRAYGSAMLKTQLADFGLPVGCHWQSNHPLKERLAMLKKPLPGTVRRSFGLCATGFLLATGAYAAWAAQPAPAPAPKAATVAAPLVHITRLGGNDNVSPPVYPPAALANHLSGDVLLELKIEASGDVSEVRVVSAVPAGVFEQAAIAAASKWHFGETSRDSRGIRPQGWVRVPVQFRPE